jgi:hypothetical protein
MIILIAIALIFLQVNHFILSHGGYAFSIFHLLIIILAAAMSWGFHMAVLYYYSFKASLC